MKLATPQGPALVLPCWEGVRELRTRRTLLRQWQDDDLEPWVAMNADPEVRRHFPSVLTRDEALAEAARMRAMLTRRGWGAWALPANEASRRVMARIGMVHDEGGDFAHPRLAPGHPMSRHVLYRMHAPVDADTFGNHDRPGATTIAPTTCTNPEAPR